MELTEDLALQQGIAAHKEGKLQDAERLYRTILQAQPNHPEANHNLGLLAVAAGKHLDALPLFMLALDANPQIEQFWLSYVDLLIKLERCDQAKRVIVEGEKSGVSSDKFDALNQQLHGSIPSYANKTAEGPTLGATSDSEPPQDQVHHLIEYYQAGKFKESEALAISLTRQFPKHPFGWKVLGTVYTQMGRLRESLAPKQKATELSPQDAEANNNLGVTLKKLGRLGESEVSYRKAIALKPDYAEAQYNLGNTLKELGRLDESEASFRQAIAIKPDYAEAHNNLGVTLKELGRLDKSEASLRQAIALKPDYAEACSNLGNTLRELGRLDESEASHRKAIALKPDNAEAHNNLGTTLKELGRLNEAEANYRQAMTLRPSYKLVARNLLTLPVGQLDLKTLELCEKAFPTPGYLPEDQVAHSFFQANLLKHRGLFDQSFREFRKANKLKFESIQNEITLESGRNSQSFNRIKEWVPIAPAADNEGLVKLFIMGPSRSGKSLTEHILRRSPQVKALFEAVNYSSLLNADINEGNLTGSLFDSIFCYSEEELLLQGYRVVTSTRPASIFYADYLLDTLPNTYFLVINRDIQDLSAEIFTKEYASRNHYSYDIDAIRNYLSVYKNICCILHSKVPDKCISVNFEDIVEDPDNSVRRIGELVSEKFGMRSYRAKGTKFSTASIFRDHFAAISGKD